MFRMFSARVRHCTQCHHQTVSPLTLSSTAVSTIPHLCLCHHYCTISLPYCFCIQNPNSMQVLRSLSVPPLRTDFQFLLQYTTKALSSRVVVGQTFAFLSSYFTFIFTPLGISLAEFSATLPPCTLTWSLYRDYFSSLPYQYPCWITRFQPSFSTLICLVLSTCLRSIMLLYALLIPLSSTRSALLTYLSSGQLWLLCSWYALIDLIWTSCLDWLRLISSAYLCTLILWAF